MRKARLCPPGAASTASARGARTLLVTHLSEASDVWILPGAGVHARAYHVATGTRAAFHWSFCVLLHRGAGSTQDSENHRVKKPTCTGRRGHERRHHRYVPRQKRTHARPEKKDRTSQNAQKMSGIVVHNGWLRLEQLQNGVGRLLYDPEHPKSTQGVAQP
jgi:hypothetical protein